MASAKVSVRSGLLGLIKKKERQVVRPRVPRRRERPDYDLAAAMEEADEGHRKYREALEALKASRFNNAFVKMQKFLFPAWSLLYAFVKDFQMLGPNLAKFLARDEVQTAVVSVSAFIAAYCYLAGPVWWGIMWTLVVGYVLLSWIGLI